MAFAVPAIDLTPRVLCLDGAVAVYRSISLGKAIAGGVALWGWFGLTQLQTVLTRSPADFPEALSYVIGAVALPFLHLFRGRSTQLALGLLFLLGTVFYVAADFVFSSNSESNMGGLSNGMSFALLLPISLYVHSFLGPALARPIASQIGNDGNRTDGLSRRVQKLFGVWPGYRRTLAQAAITTLLGTASRLASFLAIVALSFGLGTIVAYIITYYRIQNAPPEGEFGRWWFVTEGITDWSQNVLGAVLIFTAGNCLATGLRVLARQFARQAQEELAESDRRAPIVFLRSFSNDHGTLASRRWLPLRIALGEIGRRKIDHMLIEELSDYGPTFAIGNPADKETNPQPFGAARKFVADSDWKGQVAEWAQSAVALVVVSGEGSGVRWEIELARVQFPEKTLLLFAHPQEKRNGKPLIGTFVASDGQLIELTSSKLDGDSVLMAMRAFFRRGDLPKA